MTQAQQEQKLALLKLETAIPVLEAARDVIAQWAKDGTLHQEMHNKKLSSVVNDVAKLISALQQRGPIIIVPQPAPADSKDASWFKANSSTNLSDLERKRRRETVDAEVVEDGPS
jgi:hypothetical protein